MFPYADEEILQTLRMVEMENLDIRCVTLGVNLLDCSDRSADNVAEKLQDLDGILIPGGFGERGVSGMVEAVRFAREKHVPFFGICLGLQCAVIEAARNLCGLEGADSAEINPDTPHPIIHLMSSQLGQTQKGGTMRLGAYACRLTPDTLAQRAYGTDLVHERHRHRYEFNDAYRQVFKEHGMRVAGLSRSSSPIGTLAAEANWLSE